jgi:3-oxoadipate enol-lactonase
MARGVCSEAHRGLILTNTSSYFPDKAACAAVRDMDHRPLLPKIKAPTLVIAGRYDPATPVEANEYIKNNIAGARLEVLADAHLSNVEAREVYTRAVLEFLVA